MKYKEICRTRASLTALLFVLLGYMVKFYPEQLVGFDKNIQMALRGSLPAMVSRFWTTVTLLGNVSVLLGLTLVLALFFYIKQWKAEALFLIGSFAAVGGVSTALKYLYQRPRPSLDWLMDTSGYSFPSWHTAGTFMIAGFICIVIQQRMENGFLKKLAQVVLVLLAILVALSRIYIGVHYPTDIIGGWLLSVTLLHLVYPIYDRIRFKWRFRREQK